jgi:hypothetical protein
MNELESIWKLGMDELVFYRKYENNKLIEEVEHIGNTVLSRGKTELAKSVGGLADNYINKIWTHAGGVIYNSDVTTSVTSWLGSSSASLVVTGSSTFTTPGIYTWIGCGNLSFGSVDMYNSIGTTINLVTNQELVVGVKWIFTDPIWISGSSGPRVCASLFGNISDAYNDEISTILTRYGGIDKGLYQSTNSVTNNTLFISNKLTQLIEAPVIFDNISLLTSGNLRFDKIQGFTIDLTNGSIQLNCKFVFG